MHSAIEYEVKRHAEVIESGGTLVQETRGWDDVNQCTFAQRSKENAHDYRYFPDPDFPSARLDPAWVEKERNTMPAPYEQYIAQLKESGLSDADIDALTRNDALGFLRTAAETDPSKTVLLSKRLIKDVFALVNSTGVRLDEAKLTPEMLRDTVTLQESGTINADGFRQVLAHLYANGGEAAAVAKELDLVIEQNDDAVRAAIAKVLAESEKMVAEFKAGKTATRNAIFGKVMKELQRKGDPKAVGALLDEMLR